MSGDELLRQAIRQQTLRSAEFDALCLFVVQGFGRALQNQIPFDLRRYFTALRLDSSSYFLIALF